MWHVIATTSLRRWEGRAMRILLADDDEDVRRSFLQLFGIHGYDVTAVDNGRALLKALEEDDTFDLVISDNNMPEVSGLEALKELRADERWKDLPVIIISGRVKVASEVEALGATFIDKSKFKDLHAAVEQLGRDLAEKDLEGD